MKVKHLFCLLITVGIAHSVYGQSDSNSKKFKRFHFTFEAGFNKNNIDEVISKEFADELYQGGSSFLSDHVTIGGLPDNSTNKYGVVNLAFDVNITHRLKVGIGFNGIPETQIIGYVNKDSVDPDNPSMVYDKVEELVSGITLKGEAMYVIKPYHGNRFGWEWAVGGGITTNLVNIKQKYLIQTVDSTSYEINSSEGEYNSKSSSVGAFLMTRVDVHLTRSFSLVGDFNWMFDTGVFVDETQFNFQNSSQQIGAHELKFNSYLIAVGGAFHF